MLLPQARVVRQAGHLVTPPPIITEPSSLAIHARNAVSVAFGLWPLTATMLLLVGLVIMAANGGR